jgi:hypothetical protein
VAVSVVQSATFASGSASSGTATLGAAPTGTNGLLAIVATNQNISSVSGSLAFLASATNGSLRLAAYRIQASGGAPQSVTVALGGTGLLSIFYVETTAVAFTATTGTTSTTAVSLSASLPTQWLTTIGDLPLAFFASLPASTATNQGGWTGLCALNTANGAVLDGQSGPTATSAGQAYTGSVTWSATNPAGAALLVSASSVGPYALTSQEVAEAISLDTANARSSQILNEVVGSDTANAHTSQAVNEVVGADTANARVSQAYIEVIIPLYERTSQMVMETLDTASANVRSSQMVLEVLFSSQGQRRRTVDEEWTNI